MLAFTSVEGVNAQFACRHLLRYAAAACTFSALAGSASAAGAKGAAGDWSTPGLAQPDDMQERFFKLDNGTKVQQLVGGSGTAAGEGDRVLIDYVLRRNNGYFIYSCAPASS